MEEVSTTRFTLALLLTTAAIKFLVPSTAGVTSWVCGQTEMSESKNADDISG